VRAAARRTRKKARSKPTRPDVLPNKVGAGPPWRACGVNANGTGGTRLWLRTRRSGVRVPPVRHSSARAWGRVRAPDRWALTQRRHLSGNPTNQELALSCCGLRRKSESKSRARRRGRSRRSEKERRSEVDTRVVLAYGFA
jgi:hypothetical protein